MNDIEKKPSAILLHGATLSNWSLEIIKKQLESHFHVITPVIFGHGERHNEEFVDISCAAREVIDIVHNQFDGRVKLLYGFSLGGQILCECLSKSPQITEYAIMESVLVVPCKVMSFFSKPVHRIAPRIVKSKRCSSQQAKAYSLPSESYARYYDERSKMKKQSLANISVSMNSFKVPDNLHQSGAKTMISFGEKENARVKESAELLHNAIPNSWISVARGCKHGELSLRHGEAFARRIVDITTR